MMIDLKQFPSMSGPGACHVIQAFESSGIAIRFVGGCVRDAILGGQPNDIDLAVPVGPEISMEILQSAGIQAIPTGIQFGTVTAVCHKQSFEITSLRHDVRTFGRHAIVCYGSDWHEDALRRDFTFNALYADSRGHVYDYFNGIQHLRDGKVVFIGDPRARIQEDYLRILRYFRFLAWYGRDGVSDAHVIRLCRAHSQELDVLSSERITAEFLKLLSAPHPKTAVHDLIEAGISAHIIHHSLNISAFDLLLALEEMTSLLPSSLVRFAALKIGLPLRVTHRLRLRRKDQEALALYRRQAPLFPVPEKEWGAYLYSLSPETFGVLMYLGSISKIQEGALSLEEAALVCRAAHAYARQWRKPLFPLKGRDLIAAGFKAGPGLGESLKSCERWWISQNFRPAYQDCLEWVRGVHSR